MSHYTLHSQRLDLHRYRRMVRRKPVERCQLHIQLIWQDDIATSLRHHATHHAIVKTVRQALVVRQLQGFDVTICLMNAADAQQYNTDFRHKEYATNILTFPLNVSWRGNRQYLSADIIICTDVVLREATEQGKTPWQHLAHLLVHGTLHAQGFDHEIDAEADIMETLEIKILQSLSIENPYLSSNLQ